MPKNKKRSTSLNCIKTPVTCVEWNLPPIPCLGIETGDMLDDITFALVAKVCEALNGEDLSEVNLQCLIDKLDVDEPGVRTARTFFQLAFDNDCKLFDLIQEVRALVTNQDTPLSLNLKCLAQLDDFGNQMPYTAQTVFQQLITEACNVRSQISALNLKDADLQDQIDNIPPPYTEPIVPANCFHIGTRPLSESYTLLASDYCAYKGKVGSIPQIDNMIGLQPVVPSPLDPLFNHPDLILFPGNMADSGANAWVWIKNLWERVVNLESCACQFKCSDILVGFLVTFNDENTVTLRFTGGAGTFIPTDWVDNGSTLTITNQDGVVFGPVNIEISQDGETEEIDISSFNYGDTLTFNIDAKFINEKSGMQCDKCVNKEARYITSGCCTITNSGDDPLVIIYKVC